MSKNVISICDCPISDSIFDIKNALEEPTICRVRKIFAVRYCEPGKDEPTKKHVFIWVEWTNTNAAWMFSARLNHQGEKSIFKLDRWDQPICTQVDKYGNAIAHAHWTCTPSSSKKFLEAELLYGNRSDEKIWSKFVSLGESEDISDDEQESEDISDDEQEDLEDVVEAEPSLETIQLEATMPLPIPKLVRQRADQNIPEPSKLFLLLPDPEDNDEPPELDLAGWNEIFGFEIPTIESTNSSQLSSKELHQLSCGTLKSYGDILPEFLPLEKSVLLPFPTNNLN